MPRSLMYRLRTLRMLSSMTASSSRRNASRALSSSAFLPSITSKPTAWQPITTRQPNGSYDPMTCAALSLLLRDLKSPNDQKAVLYSADIEMNATGMCCLVRLNGKPCMGASVKAWSRMRCASPGHLLTPLGGAVKQLWHFCQPLWVSETFGQDRWPRWHTGHSTLEASSIEAYLHFK